jgi:hypothetical protein
MASSSEYYVNLKKIYSERSEAEALELAGYFKSIGGVVLEKEYNQGLLMKNFSF